MAEHVHTYPVDPSQTADEAWGEICNFGQRVTYTGEPRWANVVCDGEECRNIQHERDDEVSDARSGPPTSA
jgi:hypothetical protein